MPNNLHQCIECGLLALRERDTGQLLEANDLYRQLVKTPPRAGSDALDHPLCAAGQFNLPEEVDQKNKDGTFRQPDVLAVLEAVRDCDKFLPWTRTFSPKEHLEMDMRDRLVRSQQEWQAAESKKADARHRCEMMIVVGGILIATVASVLGSLVEAGWISRPAAQQLKSPATKHPSTHP